MVSIYTDGAARGNPGPGAYSFIIKSKDNINSFAKAFRKTTNNRMELMAVIAGLETLNDHNCSVSIFSDSKYVVDSINKGWLFNWIKKGFVKVKNPDLWKTFVTLYYKHKINMVWVKGHSGHIENEMCDNLAQKSINAGIFHIDHYYENSN